jgi:hypothetical protein
LRLFCGTLVARLIVGGIISLKLGELPDGHNHQHSTPAPHNRQNGEPNAFGSHLR